MLTMNHEPIDLSNTEGVQQLVKTFNQYLAPPPKLKPSEWAERFCRIPSGNALPGPVRFRNAPFQREPLDLCIEPDCHTITLDWGAQVGKTQTQLMAMGYFIDQDPQSMMLLQPSQGDLKTWLNAKFNPMLDSTPSLKERIAQPRGRDGVNNQEMKSYPGGFLMFAWSGSPKTMRGRSAPKIFADETDGYEGTNEGHPVGLIWQRAATFGDQRLLFQTSTPTIKGESHIEAAFEEGDQRRWYVPCPHCGHKQYFKWGQVHWDKDEETAEHLPETAGYACEDCGVIWSDAERFAAIRAGEWIAAKPFKGHASFHLPEMASLFRKLADIVRSFIEKKAQNSLQTFVNVSLAETWEEEGEEIEANSLYLRREHYKAPVPKGALVLCCGVDVQDDRLEGEVVAYGEGMETWGIEEFIFHGDPGKTELWKRLDEKLQTTYLREDGLEAPIDATGVDTGGHFTDEAYKFVKQSKGRVYALKGSSQAGGPLVGRPSKRNKAKVNLFQVGTDTAKIRIYRNLSIGKVGPGYCHFPQEYDEEYFEQLTAEKRITRYRKGYPYYEWVKTRPRNEALDRRVYSLAAYAILNPALEVIKKKLDKKAKPEIKKEPSSMEKALKKPVKRRKSKSGFVSAYKR